ncbi:four helix bundle protein [candidate division WOR-3 bacterium]|nr:four helix bundle protein [candidate division WOR-3 bacterium]
MKSFRELKVWQVASKLSRDISSKLVKSFPKEEKFRLSGQIIRSSRSVPSQIAEGFRKSSLKEKNHYYEMALTSNDETENHLVEANNNDYIDNKEYKKYLNRVIKDRILLLKLIKSIEKIKNRT